MPGGLPGAPRLGRESASRKGTTALYGAQLNLHALIGAPVALAYREERGSVAQYATSERMVTARISAGRTSVQGHAASHVVDGQSTMAMGGALSQTVTDIISVEAAVGSYPANPLTGSSAGRYLNAGLSLRFSARAFRMPRAEGAPSLIDGWTRVAIETRRAQSVELAGDFTNWQFWSARRASNGVWYVDLDIPAGQYRYAFRINGTQWRIPDGAPAADDEFGGESAWLKVDRRPD
jgi:hypothetical protein